jgi:hypothetical protein
VAVDEAYEDYYIAMEQQWHWLRCADYYSPGSSSSFLVNRGNGAELNDHNDTAVTLAKYPDIGSAWEYIPEVGLLKDTQTGKVARVSKKSTSVQMTSNIRYIKENGEETTKPWDVFLWDLVPVTEDNYTT